MVRKMKHDIVKMMKETEIDKKAKREEEDETPYEKSSKVIKRK